MHFFMIIVAAIMFSLQFVFNDKFRKENGSSWNSSLKFSLYSSFAGTIVLLITNKMYIEVSVFSVITACVYSMVCIALSYASIKAFVYANLSVYSVFSMIGGMLLPFFFGILCGEEFKMIRLISCLLIVLAVILSINKGKKSKKATKYYILVFLLNGMVGVISKFHQLFSDVCVDSGSFMFLTKIITILFSLILLLLQKEHSFSVNRKSLIYSAGYSVLNSIGNLFLLIALLHLPASVQYPVVTGGVIVFSTLITLVSREKITRKEILAATVAFVSTVLMML